jgi:polyisoprenoid-binding protein YceI
VWRAAPGAFVSFSAIKNGDTPVAGKVTDVTASIDLSRLPALKGTVRIGLNSLNTGNAPRDANLRTYFFETTGATGEAAEFIPDSFQGPAFDPRNLTGKIEGTLTGSLVLHGGETKISLPVQIERTAGGALEISSVAATQVSINTLAMQDEKAALIKVCGHKSIEDGVGIQIKLALRKP